MSRSPRGAGRSFKIPDPGAMAHLGCLVEMLIREPDGTHVLHEWDDHDVHWVWSPDRKALIGVPQRLAKWNWQELGATGAINPSGQRDNHLDQPEPYRSGRVNPYAGEASTRRAAKVLRKFHARAPTRLANDVWEEHRVVPQGVVIHHKYISDKWNGRGGRRTLYIHHAPKTGSNTTAFKPGGVRGPDLVWMTGPALTVTERGVIW